MRTQRRYADYERSYWARTPSATDAPGSNGLNGASSNTGPTRAMDYATLTLQSDFNSAFQAWGLKHEFLAGFEYLHEDSYRHGLQNLGGTNAGNPPLYQPYVVSTTGTPVRFDGKSYAVYAQDSVAFRPHWKATLGLRQDELGGKWLFMHGDLAFRAALYRAEKEWERNTDLESTAALLSRERHTNGLELELAGRITDDWEVFAGLALMDAKIDDPYNGVALGSFAAVTANGTATGPTGLAGAGYVPGDAADAGQIV